MTDPMMEKAKCESFIIVDGSADETRCIWPKGHLGCHSTYTDKGIKIKWPKEDYEEKAEVIQDLYATANRVYKKYGSESDWTEWTDLRDSLAAMKEVGL